MATHISLASVVSWVILAVSSHHCVGWSPMILLMFGSTPSTRCYWRADIWSCYMIWLLLRHNVVVSIFSSAAWARNVTCQELSVCLCVNQGDWDRNCYMWRLVTLHRDLGTHSRQFLWTFSVKIPPEKNVIWAFQPMGCLLNTIHYSLLLLLPGLPSQPQLPCHTVRLPSKIALAKVLEAVWRITIPRLSEHGRKIINYSSCLRL